MDDVNGLKICQFNGRGYKKVLEYKSWCMAYLTQDEEYTKNTYMERHLETDEVFVLLQGEATLYIGENRTPVKMEPLKFYNVTEGTWHNIVCSEDASVLITESNGTNKTNTEYFTLSE